ncbi:hypothetical protein CWC16_10195 [Pseudoalteromonas sp. S3776]|uniref:hypothetical protein n=1 Tax=Pseudoalteromonas sp. S3776 TaxID=579544 RepID=UPI00126D116D|nr:hypothetical protein [Pseudoalteromonas sp. S3776]TMO79962.1 hypothetical protein CWC16_10195 [Pseudoalteromonas sp. S3776]
MASGMTVPDAIRFLFGIDVAKESTYLKDKANSLVRNKLIKVETELKVQRSTKRLADGQLDVLFNALLLNAIFHDPKDVKKIFEDKGFRYHCAVIVSQLFGESNSLLGIALSKTTAAEFANALASDCDLRKKRLPNPFAVMPQLALGKNLSLLHALLAQSALTSSTDNLLLAYLNNDIDKALALSRQLDTNNHSVKQLVEHITSRHKEAEEFDDLLGYFQKM